MYLLVTRRTAMKGLTRKRYLRNMGITYLIEKLEALSLAARIRQEIFFNLNLKAFKKYSGGD